MTHCPSLPPRWPISPGYRGDFTSHQKFKQKSELEKQDEHLDMLLESVKRISVTSKKIADELHTQNVYVRGGRGDCRKWQRRILAHSHSRARVGLQEGGR